MSDAELQLLMDMGFPRERAEKALSAVGNQGLEAAAEWLLTHSDDSGGVAVGSGQVLGSASDGERSDSGEGGGGAVAVPSASLGEGHMVPPPQVRSLKCEDCGKQFRSELDAESHASKTKHQNFSESTEDVRPLTEEEKKAQLARLEERLQQNRTVRLEQERLEAKQREQIRRKSNREISQAREELGWREAKKLAEQKKREKEEDRQAKQRVKEQIARDRAEKAARDKAERAAREAAASGGGVTMPQSSSPEPLARDPVASSQPKKEYDTCRLQIRQFSGQPLTHNFQASDTLVDVNRFIMMNRVDDNTPFSLMTNFPKHVFTPDEMQKTLKELGLVPAAVLILTRLN